MPKARLLAKNTHFWIIIKNDPNQVRRPENFWAKNGSPVGAHLAARIECEVRVRILETEFKSKNARKQTGFKIQFYIRIHVSQKKIEHFMRSASFSPSPNEDV